ncbi:unnamed protein product [Caenorhabditis angaria]|uniref:Protein-tyrosine-phosphatase n=1 Tax=Caenorhabditis angaria TaxID=860376 RepID=A0A9P1IEL5_9PELO|nr:unnamed protein product [Caenorhabditis angaria]
MNKNNKTTSGYELKRNTKSKLQKTTTIRSDSDEPSSNISKKEKAGRKLVNTKKTKSSSNEKTKNVSKQVRPIKLGQSFDGESDTEKVIKPKVLKNLPSVIGTSQLSSEASPETSNANRKSAKSVSLAPTQSILQTRRKKFIDFAAKCQRVTLDELLYEFEHLPTQPPNEKCAAFLNPVNRRKNRYLDIRCLEQSRVILNFLSEKEEGSGYIHANYVANQYLQHRYILTQAPKSNTISDFWRMVWQEETKSIVMLCDFFENGKEKCSKYYPLSEGNIFRLDNVHDNFFIQNQSITKERGMICTKLKLCFKNEPVRIINHYQFLEWPDFNVPSPTSTKSILQILSRVRKDTTPTIIHCAAGIGRSGTLIATEIAICAMENFNPPEIQNIVADLRIKGRCGSVQTFEQYLLIRKLVLEYGVTNNFITEESFKTYSNLYMLAIRSRS